jgi:hypothetical protein
VKIDEESDFKSPDTNIFTEPVTQVNEDLIPNLNDIPAQFPHSNEKSQSETMPQTLPGNEFNTEWSSGDDDVEIHGRDTFDLEKSDVVNEDHTV